MSTRYCLLLLLCAGCAEMFGIEPTTAPIDAKIDGPSAVWDSSVDARGCGGGDAHVADPVTGACYVFFATPMTRDAARATCLGLGTGVLLASVQSAAENATIASLIGTNIAFLGGNDEVVEGTFRWEDGSAVILTNWNTGEPNNGAGANEEDCIVMVGTLGGKWDDHPCAPPPVGSGSYAFVCERD